MAEQAQFTLDTVFEDAEKAVTEREDGDLLIEGLASDIGIDREDEAFEPGAFQKGVERFLAGQRPLLYHHHNDQQLGEVIDLEARPDGLYFKAIVTKPVESSPLLHVYNLIKRGMMKAVSVRGLFRKRGNRIYEADLAEISVTPFPVNPRALFQVAQKAFEEEPQAEATAEELRQWFEERFNYTQHLFDELTEKAAARQAEQ